MKSNEDKNAESQLISKIDINEIIVDQKNVDHLFSILQDPMQKDLTTKELKACALDNDKRKVEARLNLPNGSGDYILFIEDEEALAQFSLLHKKLKASSDDKALLTPVLVEINDLVLVYSKKYTELLPFLYRFRLYQDVSNPQHLNQVAETILTQAANNVVLAINVFLAINGIVIVNVGAGTNVGVEVKVAVQVVAYSDVAVRTTTQVWTSTSTAGE